jgi:hypothetical protein
VPQFAPALHIVLGTQPEHLSSVAVLLDCVQVLPVGQLFDVAVHCSQCPKSTLDGLVSQTGVPPLHPVPSSLQEQSRHAGGDWPAVHRAGAPVPTVMQLLSVLLHCCCTVHVVPPLVMVPYWNAQMSPISPQLLSPHAHGRA